MNPCPYCNQPDDDNHYRRLYNDGRVVRWLCGGLPLHSVLVRWIKRLVSKARQQPEETQ